MGEIEIRMGILYIIYHIHKTHTYTLFLPSVFSCSLVRCQAGCGSSSEEHPKVPVPPRLEMVETVHQGQAPPQRGSHRGRAAAERRGTQQAEREGDQRRECSEGDGRESHTAHGREESALHSATEGMYFYIVYTYMKVQKVYMSLLRCIPKPRGIPPSICSGTHSL